MKVVKDAMSKFLEISMVGAINFCNTRERRSIARLRLTVSHGLFLTRPGDFKTAVPSRLSQMLLLDGGSTSISNFLPTPNPPIPPTLSKFWTSAYAKTAPSAVQSWHNSFLEAGSEIITTSTYQFPLQEDSP